ncbi:hypothetical protein [Thiorhodovibrio frisius]|uniref:Uncharacterized protein n=1 Tax=Thiorhodovibrio frisius TaxID=631362 RepID=H8Z7B5_9GAMM|nr:hypothetical protein [Thiorhodovibrio frisius]EIC19831.1 hypothetical protein Thi970DRAFT_03435 [Thiorhodovibrio frisius]WPL20559.1 hypothetical protein Thiofri_00658 [Thiorhodovibrio frisius]
MRIQLQLGLVILSIFIALPAIAAKPVSIEFHGKVNNGPNYGYGIKCSNGVTYDIVAWGDYDGDYYTPPPWEEDNQKYGNFDFDKYTGQCIDILAYRFCETR